MTAPNLPLPHASLIVVVLTPFLFSSCYWAARAEAYKASPICGMRDGKCREYKTALKHSRKGSEPLGLQLLREDCDGYRLACEDDVQNRVEAMGVE